MRLGSPAVLTTALFHGYANRAGGQYVVGRDSASRVVWRTSPTTPMISSADESVHEIDTCCPIGSSSGQYFRAIVALMITRWFWSPVSRESKRRPARSGIPIALK